MSREEDVIRKLVPLDEGGMEALLSEDKTCPVLVRCGGGKFICSVEDVKYFVKIITEHGDDYVRDVSIIQNGEG